MPQRFDEWQTFDVSYGAAHLHQNDLSPCGFGDQADPAFDLVGDVRDDLNRTAQEISAPLGPNHLGINLAGRNIAHLVQSDIDKTFVMSQVKIGFSPIIKDEHLPVLVRAHRSRVDIDIGVQFLDGNLEPSLL